MKWTFAKKIVATLAVLGTAYALSAGATWWALEKMAAKTKSTITQDMAQLEHVGQLRYLVLQIRRAEKDISIDLAVRPEGIKKRVDRWNELARELTTESDLVIASANEEQYELLEKARISIMEYVEGSKTAVGRVASGELANQADFEKAIDEPKKVIRVAEDVSGKVIAALSAKSAAEYKNIEEALLQVRWVLGVGAGVIVVLSLVLGGLLVRSLRRPIQALAQVMNAVGQGDLGIRADASGRDELSVMAGSFNDMVERLRQTLSKVQLATQSIANSSDAVASGNRDLSERTEQGASSLQETASAMEQLSGTVAQSADTANSASGMAARAASSAQQGGVVVDEAIKGMQRIREASQRIADITGLIDAIAFQTNILALNAAVEAARAGEQGRGFAVVASEVRALAGRSGTAAREIKGLIEQSMTQVEGGTRSVNEAGKVMLELVGQVQQVHQLMDEISNASIQQRDGIGQVNHAVGLLDQMMQSNAALVEESTAAAETMRSEGRELAHAVQYFKLTAPA